MLLASSDFAGNGTLSFLLEHYQIIEPGIVLVLFCITKQGIKCVRQCLCDRLAHKRIHPNRLILIGICHSINPSAGVSEYLIPLLVCAVKVRHVRALLHRRALVNLIYPVLESRELG